MKRVQNAADMMCGSCIAGGLLGIYRGSYVVLLGRYEFSFGCGVGKLEEYGDGLRNDVLQVWSAHLYFFFSEMSFLFK